MQKAKNDLSISTSKCNKLSTRNVFIGSNA